MSGQKVAPVRGERGDGGCPLVGRIDLGLDVERLREETDRLLARTPMIFELTQQLAIQLRPGSTDPWYESCYQEKDIAPEGSYDTLNPQLRGSYFEEVLNAFPFPVRRARLMGLAGRGCYSVHRDATARYHVAIRSSEHALFVFAERNEVVTIPVDGNAYLVDTRELHTAMNGARDLRIHLVVAAADRPWR